jgi:2-polyprenyl-3-methyl-5-hydroxy-6-metoxy-1,4-benzoquinol methylase
MDARELPIDGQKFDVVYCAHNLEHFHRHDAAKVLKGFVQSLNEDGYAHILVPDVGEVMRQFVYGRMDMESILGESPAGPIAVHDVIYGWGAQIEHGNEFYAHKTGFTMPLLHRMLTAAGFKMSRSRESKATFEIEVLAYLKE